MIFCTLCEITWDFPQLEKDSALLMWVASLFLEHNANSIFFSWAFPQQQRMTSWVDLQDTRTAFNRQDTPVSKREKDFRPDAGRVHWKFLDLDQMGEGYKTRLARKKPMDGTGALENSQTEIGTSQYKKVARALDQLRCIYVNAHRMGSKQEDLEAILYQNN